MSAMDKSKFEKRVPVKRPTVILVTEGKVTEKQYFKMWARKLRTNFTLTIIDHKYTNPLGLVEVALQCKTEYANPDNPPIIWCIGDEDDHLKLKEALLKARANGISYALSIPCIELWFVLHFQDQTAHLNTKKVHSACKKHLKNYDKSLTEQHLELLFTNYQSARTRAIFAEKWHAAKYVDEESRNPSSNIWHLVDQLQKF
jgi:hypothetical protein